VLEKGSLDWQRREGRRLGERLGAPTVLFKAGKEIVAADRGAYPEKFGRWRDFLNRIVVGSVELRSDRCLGLVLFDQNYRMDLKGMRFT
jgi:hypothetical protein